MIHLADRFNRPIWTAFPRQEQALLSTSFETLFGGSRGPGKTAAGIVWLLLGNNHIKPLGHTCDAGYYLHPLYRALVLRKNSVDLADWIHKAKQIFQPLGGKFRGSPMEFYFPSGATVVLGHLDDADSYEKYVGQEFVRILLEEATLVPKEYLYLQVMASCRSPFPEFRCQIFLTANPGNVGHAWCRDRFITATNYGKTEYVDPDTGLTRRYIPAGVKDNPIYANDKQYVGQLMSLPPALRRAWLDGDWDAIAGQYFDEWLLEKHTVLSHEARLEPWYYRWLSCDWGYTHNAAVYKYCQEPNGRIHVYDELSVSRTTPEELGSAIGRFIWPEIQAGGQKAFRLFLSPDAFSRRTDERTVADQVAAGLERVIGSNSIYILPAENGAESNIYGSVALQRDASVIIARAANQRVPGWMYMKTLMRFWPLIKGDQVSDAKFDPQEALRLQRESPKKAQDYIELFRSADEVLPKVLVHRDKCPRAINAIPLARAQDPDKGDPEDVDKKHFDGMDEIDSLRYGLFAHKYMEVQEPFESFFSKHMAAFAPGPLEALDGNTKVWMARTAEAKYQKLTNPSTAPIRFNQSGARARRKREIQLQGRI